jgi:NADPH:quinone reductase-like Zn-dependent oxidoreductase
MTLSSTEQNRLRQHYGPWAVITGASSGIGLELATQLAQAGFNLVINARSPRFWKPLPGNYVPKPRPKSAP